MARVAGDGRLRRVGRLRDRAGVLMTPRTMRSTHWWLRWFPSWYHRTAYEVPVNWLLFRWFDFVPIVLAVVLAQHAPEWVYTLLAAYCFVVFPVIVILRMRRRRRWCREHHHFPYCPVPEVDEWECEWCGAALNMREPQVVATRQRQAALFQDQRGPARESTARRVFELSRLLRQAINGSVR